MRFYLILLVFYSSLVLAWPLGGVIYNDATDKKIAIGVHPEGHLNVGRYNREFDIVSNATATGLAYKFPNGNWYDATAPGCHCEGWSAGATSSEDGRQAMGEASVDTGPVKNIHVKSFVVDETSIESVVSIKENIVSRFGRRLSRPANDKLEVKHVYGPAKLASEELFEVNVTMTNVSGHTLNTVRYNRTMDWDIHPTEFREVVSIVGVEESKRSATKPRIYHAGNNGFRNPNVFNTDLTGYARWPISRIDQNMHRVGPNDHGFTATFEFDDLVCGGAHHFKIYYGAAASRELMIAAFAKEGVPMYSIGEQSARTGVVFGFGFKGVSGTALARSLPEKSAILPGGVMTDPDVVQTYAPPLIATVNRREFYSGWGTTVYVEASDKYAYQSVFKYRKDHQWEGDILRYTLDSNGDFTPGEIPVSAAKILKDRINESNYERSYEDGGRNIWTVGQTFACSSSGHSITPNAWSAYQTRLFLGYAKTPPTGNSLYDLNNFVTTKRKSGYSPAESGRFEPFFYNCQTGDDTEDIIKFVRGYDAWNEDGPSGTKGPGNMRKSLLGDMFHSNLVYVGPPSDSYAPADTNEKSEAYFRKIKRYDYFKRMYAHREGRIYVGANDGMLHSFDKDLNLKWSFIPPPILSKLRALKGADPSGTTNGTSNSKFLVDGPIVVKDVHDPSNSNMNKWRTILVGALGYGGKGYFALDISHPDNPMFLGAVENDDKNNRVLRWDEGGDMTVHKYGTGASTMALTDTMYPYQYLGFTLSKPSITLLPYAQKPVGGRWSSRYGHGIQQRYALVFGAGYADGMSTNQGNYVIVADAVARRADGMFYGAAAPDGQRYNDYGPFNTLAWTKVPQDPASDANKGVTAAVSVVIPDKLGDNESDYYGGIAYFTDLHGQLWKWNLSRNTLPSASTTYEHYQELGSRIVTANNDTANGDSSMHGLTKLWRSETTVANDRFGSHQVATTLVDSGAGKYIYNYFGTGDQTHVQTRYTTIDNRIIGARDIDFPAPTATLSGTDKIASSDGIHKVNLGGAGSSCSSIGAPGWYGDLNDRFANKMPRATGRILIKNKNLYIPVYTPENKSCAAYGQSTIMVMTNGCSGSITTIDTGTGISTSAVSDSDGNIYIGLSNQEESSRVADSASRVGNIVKLGKAILPEEEAAASPPPGIRIKSWRELFNY